MYMYNHFYMYENGATTAIEECSPHAAYTSPRLQHLDVSTCIILTELEAHLRTVTHHAKEQETADPYEETPNAMSETPLQSRYFIGRHHDQHPSG